MINLSRSLNWKFFLCPLAGALLVAGSGCGGGKQATSSDETFFKPLTAAAPSAETKPAIAPPSGAKATVPPPVVSAPSPAVKTDSLLSSLKDQDRRLTALTAQLALLGSARKGVRPDTTRTTARPQTPAPKPAPSPAAEIDNVILEAERLYESRDYRRTIALSQEQLKDGKRRETEDRYLYLIGASHYRLKQFDLASVFLKRVLGIPGTKKKAETHFMLGLTYVQLGMTDRARSMYEAALKESPTGDLAQSVQGELRRLARVR